MASRVFSRAIGRDLPVAVRAHGVWIEDESGFRYLDAAGGALVCGIGHGRAEIAKVLADQAGKVDYVHGTAFTTEILEAYCEELSRVLPVSDARIYPVSGGSEAIETAVKLARSYHLARGEAQRTTVLGRWGSYHGNTLGALDVSGRPPLREPYLPWLGRFHHQPPVYEYRCPCPHHPIDCGRWHAERLEERIIEGGDVAAFLAEPISGASLGAAVPPDDYWHAVAEVCRRHGVLLIADEVMTGFGRTGAWFASEHWNLRPDVLVAGKGVSSGYWPLGLCVASGDVWETVKEGGFPHGFTNSHHPIGAAVGRAVLRILSEEGLIEEAARKGVRLEAALRSALEDHPAVGDIRGKGLLVGVELVADRGSKRPHPRSERIVEGLRDACMREGLVIYPSTGCADGANGDLFLLGPPLIISDAEIDQLVERLSRGLATLSRLVTPSGRAASLTTLELRPR